MRRYKLTLTLEYYFTDENYLREEELTSLLEKKATEINKMFLPDTADENMEIVKAHLDRLPF